MKGKCVYHLTNDKQEVRVWKETGEKVCLNCRQNLLEQEFEEDEE